VNEDGLDVVRLFKNIVHFFMSKFEVITRFRMK
jgi:hypothetical protein